MTEASLEIGPDREGVVYRILDGLVVEAAREEDLGPGRVAERLNAGRGRVEPGAVNSHTHIYSGMAPLGMPEPEKPPRNFLEILERIWWRLDRALDEASLRASARFYVARALLAGTSTLVDHHESPNFVAGSLDVLADVCEDLGMRAVLCYGATERNRGAEEAREGLHECRRFIMTNRRRAVRGVVGLHASFTVSDQTIREAGRLARDLGTVVHVHVAEDLADVRDAEARGYEGPLERLLALDGLPPGSILAHGVHLGAAQVRRAAAEGLWLVQNPRSNLGNGVGYPRALRASDRTALGTDGFPADMTEEAAELRRGAAEHNEPEAAVEARLAGGRRLVGERFKETLSPLAAGCASDVAVYDGGSGGVSFAGPGPRHLVVAGRLVVRDGVLVTADFDRIQDEVRAGAPKLWERMERFP